MNKDCFNPPGEFMVKVKFFGNLRQIAGKSSLSVDGDSVNELLKAIQLLNEPLVEAIMDQAGLRPYYKIMLNGLDISFLDGLETHVHQEDIVAIFPPIAGGTFSLRKNSWH